MIEPKVKYSDAQKRASEKYRMNNKDKLNTQRQCYYSKKKEEDPLYLEKKRQKSREYYLKKKNSKEPVTGKLEKSEIHYLIGDVLYRMDVKNFEPCKLDEIDNLGLHKSKLTVLIDNILYKMDVEITGQRTVEESVIEETDIEKPVIEEPVIDDLFVEEPVKSELQNFLDSVMIKMNSEIIEEPKVEELIVEEPKVEESIVDEPELILKLKLKKPKSKSKKII